MMPEQKVPSIGRVVHYNVPEDERKNCNYASVLPAVIVRIWSNECVNLKVLNDEKEDFWRTSVVLGDQEGEWFWPPYVPSFVPDNSE
jgi:hypothetical protein